MRNPITPAEQPVIDPRWSEYLDTREFGRRAAAGHLAETPHERNLRDLMDSIIQPWQHGSVSSRETLIRLKRLADLQL